MASVQTKPVGPPPYGKRRGFVPRLPSDFGDGGAFPEVHVAQYPLGMGRPGKTVTATRAVVTSNVASTALVVKGGRQGFQSKTFGQHTDLVPKEADESKLDKPTEDEEAIVAARTKAALEQLVSGKIAAARPVTVPEAAVARAEKSKYVRYTPSENAPGRLQAKQRIIRMVEAPVDPMEPPKFKHKKTPGGPPSPPAPVMHSPPRKVTVADQQAWNIPPCVSNWKNAKGYTIPLDKRLAADGRSLQQATINDKFASFSEAMYVAERKARESVEARLQVQRHVLMQEKEQHEAHLRELASKARAERSGLMDGGDGEGGAAGEGNEVDEARKKRDAMRADRKRERERDLRLEALGKKAKTTRDLDRDVSEKIALGMHTGGKVAGEAMYDQRLFNQTAGISSGFVDPEDEDVYSKPMRSEAQGIYRPKAFEADGRSGR